MISELRRGGAIALDYGNYGVNRYIGRGRVYRYRRACASLFSVAACVAALRAREVPVFICVHIYVRLNEKN